MIPTHQYRQMLCRAVTCAALADPEAVGEDFNMPGHILPLRARPGGCWRGGGTRRRGWTWPASPAAPRLPCCAR